MKTKNNFRLRASASSQIMGIKALGKTGHSFIEGWVKEQVYGRRKHLSNKYLDKGNACENEAIELVSSECFDGAMMFKNEEFFRNDYFTGTPDLIHDGKIIDIKCSWDAFTFPLFEKELPTKDYFYQMQVYMQLTGLDKAEVIYCLMNTPEDLIYKENPEDHNYDNIETKYRIKRFEVLRDDEVIEKMKSRVIESREYIEKL